MTTQQEDPVLKTMIKWISGQKVQDLKHLLGSNIDKEEGKTILQEMKKLTLYQGALHHCPTPGGELEEVLWFMVPKAHWVALKKGCHQDAGHQDQTQTLYLLHDCFWWPGMASQMQKAVLNCEQCIHHEGTHDKAPMQPISFTAPLELLHVDLTSIEMMIELDQTLNVMSVFCLLWPFYKTHYDICDPRPNCKNCC